jgi:hypothetical protein
LIFFCGLINFVRKTWFSNLSNEDYLKFFMSEFFFPSLNGLSTIWFNVDYQFVDYAFLMKIICYIDVNVMAYLHNMWVFFYHLVYLVDCHIYMHYLILNLSVTRIRKKATEWDFIIYLNKSDMKINLIQCKSFDENLGNQRKAP